MFFLSIFSFFFSFNRFNQSSILNQQDQSFYKVLSWVLQFGEKKKLMKWVVLLLIFKNKMNSCLKHSLSEIFPIFKVISKFLGLQLIFFFSQIPLQDGKSKWLFGFTVWRRQDLQHCKTHQEQNFFHPTFHKIMPKRHPRLWLSSVNPSYWDPQLLHQICLLPAPGYEKPNYQRPTISLTYLFSTVSLFMSTH